MPRIYVIQVIRYVRHVSNDSQAAEAYQMVKIPVQARSGHLIISSA